jgi:hypothetical protein
MSTIIPQIFKARKVLLEILKKRGFNTDEYIGTSFNEISKLFTNKQLDMLLEKEGKKI